MVSHCSLPDRRCDVTLIPSRFRDAVDSSQMEGKMVWIINIFHKLEY